MAVTKREKVAAPAEAAGNLLRCDDEVKAKVDELKRRFGFGSHNEVLQLLLVRAGV